MQITVFGATGTFGARLVDQLRQRGHTVIAAHRGTGVDTYTGRGVAEAAEGSDVLVDCVNRMTMNGRQAVDYFSHSSRSIAVAAAEQPGTSVACLSIAFRPEVGESKLLGYYQGKAMQERIYRRIVPSDRLLMFRSAQWFELVDAMTMTVGPLRFVPKMRVQALAAAEAARMMAEAIDSGETGTIEVAGPEISDFAAIARRLAEARARSAGEKSPKVIGIPLPGPASRDGLIPPSPRLSDVTVDEWLRTR
ncbi:MULTISPECIES: SDR family oxidoreductase [unclassified Brevibacterium]|uniref:SDR family oxidoreductase n=1 Tax=unclassified Brevibacterium TaxID=2614124 RepID=UPI00109255E7|nr:SDR family oxidoreductase [Brevibacterium sp. S22]TGD29661.1 SDR family oxidoreductase [Brevibacterium sp. S22]